MTATLKLNLGECLTQDELHVLINEAAKRGVSLERVVYDAVHELAAKPQPTPPTLPPAMAVAAA